MITLYPHQQQALDQTKDKNHVAYYHDMGLGKTFTGAEKMVQLGAKVNLVVCQKSKIEDWIEHFETNVNGHGHIFSIFDLTDNDALFDFMGYDKEKIGVINYDLVWRRKELLTLCDFTLMLDESSLIQNETAKRSKFILKMKPANVILLSGTPTGGKYEKLWSQMRLLGWNISKRTYWSQYIEVEYLDTMGGRSIPIVTGYKNVDRLKRKMIEHGCQFLKTEEIFDLPTQTFQKVKIDSTKEYRTFRKTNIVIVNNNELVGDTTLTKMLYERQLCGQYNGNKLAAFRDLVESTNDRLIVFYNFTEELLQMEKVAFEMNRPRSIVNGNRKDLLAYEKFDDSITFIQYQAGAMGLNLQKANKIIYFSLPLSSELFEQSKKRIHRIGQEKPCFYYLMICKGSIEERILKTLEMRKDFTEKLFEKEV